MKLRVATAVIAIGAILGKSAWSHDPQQIVQYLEMTPNTPANTGTPQKAMSSDNSGSLQALVGVPQAVQDAAQAIILRDHIWPTPNLTVCFGPQAAVNSRAVLVSNIIAIAKEWQQGTNLKLDFGGVKPRICASATSANIRVDIAASSDGKGLFESLIGNEAADNSIQGYAPYSAALLFPAKNSYFANEAVIRFYVLHEFGHALGAEHEHQRIDCDYNYTYIAKVFNFTSAQNAEDNLKPVFTTAVTAYPDGKAIVTQKTVETEYDNYSIMKYNLSTMAYPSGDDPNVYVHGTASTCYRSQWVSKLTAYDLAGMQLAYSSPNIATAALLAALTKPPAAGALSPSAKFRLTDPKIGRAMIAELALSTSESHSQSQISGASAAFKDIALLRSSPKALAYVEAILSQRAAQ